MNRILGAFKVLTKKKDKASEEKTKPPADASPTTPKYFEQGLPLLEQSGLRSIEKDDIITAAVAYVGVYNPRTGTQGVRRLHSVGISKPEFQWLENMGHNRIELDDKHDPENEW